MMNLSQQFLFIALLFIGTTVNAQRELDSSYAIYDYGMELGTVISTTPGIIAGGLNFYAERGKRKFVLGATFGKFNYFGAIFNFGTDVVIIPELCSGCDKCLPACPVNCIYPFADWQEIGSPSEWWSEPGSDNDPYIS